MRGIRVAGNLGNRQATNGPGAGFSPIAGWPQMTPLAFSASMSLLL